MTSRIPVRRRLLQTLVPLFIALFCLPMVVRIATFGLTGPPRSDDVSSMGILPLAADHPDARVLVFTARIGAWRGVLSSHSWIVIKRANATSWTRHDLVGWGNPLIVNGWAPDGRWFGDDPRVAVDVKGKEAERIIPAIEAALQNYPYRNISDYRTWPGPNSNTFIAMALRAVPELSNALPSNAIGRDFRPHPFFGVTESGTGIELNLWGAWSFKIGWVEGIEINCLGFVAGLDLRHPAVKLPGYGRLGFDNVMPSGRTNQKSDGDAATSKPTEEAVGAAGPS